MFFHPLAYFIDDLNNQVWVRLKPAAKCRAEAQTLGHLLLFFLGHYWGAGLEMRHPGHRLVSISDAGSSITQLTTSQYKPQAGYISELTSRAHLELFCIVGVITVKSTTLLYTILVCSEGLLWLWGLSIRAADWAVELLFSTVEFSFPITTERARFKWWHWLWKWQ